jgi:hypothetical protein
MAYVGGGWALLGNHQIWSYSGRCNMYFQVYAWSEQDVVNNRSTVHTRTRILVENKNPHYTGYRVEQDWSVGVTGAPNYSAHATLSDGGAGTSKEYILQNGLFTVDHDSNGNASSKVHYWFNGTYTGAIGSPYNTNVVDISLPKIDRTADKATISNVGSTYKTMYCTISVPFVSEENQWSRDGKTWTDWNKAIKANTPFVDTWTGLKPNSSLSLLTPKESSNCWIVPCLVASLSWTIIKSVFEMPLLEGNSAILTPIYIPPNCHSLYDVESYLSC